MRGLIAACKAVDMAFKRGFLGLSDASARSAAGMSRQKGASQQLARVRSAALLHQILGKDRSPKPVGRLMPEIFVIGHHQSAVGKFEDFGVAHDWHIYV